MSGIIFYAPCSECGKLIPSNEYHFCMGMIATTANKVQTIPYQGEYLTGGKH